MPNEQKLRNLAEKIASLPPEEQEKLLYVLKGMELADTVHAPQKGQEDKNHEQD